jgi:hypothetical protein
LWRGGHVSGRDAIRHRTTSAGLARENATNKEKLEERFEECLSINGIPGKANEV